MSVSHRPLALAALLCAASADAESQRDLETRLALLQAEFTCAYVSENAEKFTLIYDCEAHDNGRTLTVTLTKPTTPLLAKKLCRTFAQGIGSVGYRYLEQVHIRYNQLSPVDEPLAECPARKVTNEEWINATREWLNTED